MTTAQRLVIEGSVSNGFEPVREAFVENFTHRGELGAACCIYQGGEKVVDLWGGVRDRTSGETFAPLRFQNHLSRSALFIGAPPLGAA